MNIKELKELAEGSKLDKDGDSYFDETDLQNMISDLMDKNKFDLDPDDIAQAILLGLGFDLDDAGEIVYNGKSIEDLENAEDVIDDFEDYVDDEDEIDEAFIKKAASDRLKIRRKEKIERRKGSVKNDLKQRAKKAAQCGPNKRVTKIGPRMYKCIAKTAKDKKKSRILKKWRKLYKH